MSLSSIIKRDPLVQMLTGKKGTTKKRKSSKKSGLSASEKRIVNAVARRTKPTKKKRKY